MAKRENSTNVKKIDVTGKKVHLTFEVGGGNIGKTNKPEFSAIVDFSKCSEAEILAFASKAVIIGYQGKLRNMDAAFVRNLAKEEVTIDAANFREDEMGSAVTKFAAIYDKLFKDEETTIELFNIIATAWNAKNMGELPTLEEVKTYRKK